MECGQVQKFIEALATTLYQDSEGNVRINVELLQDNCPDLLEAITCDNNHLSPEQQLIKAIGEDDCDHPTLKINLRLLLTMLSDVYGTPDISGMWHLWNEVTQRYELQLRWDDLPPTPITSARLGATAPTLATFIGSIQQYTFDPTNDYVIGSTEITHGWAEGTIIDPHIHWATNGLEATAKGVQWQLKWSIGNPNGTFGAEQTSVIDVTIPANTPDRTHLISDFSPEINGAGYVIGTYIVWRLARIATAHANGAPAADPFGIAVGFHAQLNTFGSTLEDSK